MIHIQRPEPRAHLTDAFYSRAIKWIQDSFVQADVWLDARRGGAARRQPPPAFVQRLAHLGLDAGRVRWTPLTLKYPKLQLLMDEITRQPPRRLLEAGSGVSTAVFAALAERYAFEVLTLENHPGSVQYIQELTANLPTSDRLSIQLCEFKRCRRPGIKPYYWFDAQLNVGDGNFDFVFIDAPMGQLAGRRGALYELAPYLAAQHRIFLDDADRAHEQQCLSEWRRTFPDLTIKRFAEVNDIVCLSIGGGQ